MALIDSQTLLRIADRAAFQFFEIKNTLIDVSKKGLDYYWKIISDTQDADVEIPLQGIYYTVDQDFSVSNVVKYGTNLTTILFTMQDHFNRSDGHGDVLQKGGWDGYLRDKDERVSQYFAELFFITYGFYMLAVNVFSEGIDDFGIVEVKNSGIEFTDGKNYGNGHVSNPANGSYFAATQLKAVVDVMGTIDLDLRLSVKDINNELKTIDVAVPGNSPSGTEIEIGGVSDRFLDVTDITFKPAGSTGSLGDNIIIRNLKERQIVL